jgi:hypothetical protein
MIAHVGELEESAVKQVPKYLILLLFPLLFACTPPTQAKLGVLSLRFGSEYAAAMEARALADTGGRSLTPGEPWQAARFAVQGSGPDGNTISLESAESGATAKVVPGTWNIVVNAYTASGKETGSGSCSLILKPSQTTQATIQILPLAGTGNISLGLERNMAVPAGSTLSGTLTHLGLPGRPEEGIAAARAVSIPADQPGIVFENVPAGHYSLVMSLKDDAGMVVGGVAETLFVMKGFLTSGTCRFVMGTPELDLATEIMPAGPLDSPIMSVSHRVPEMAPFLPLALTSIKAPDSATLTAWYLNGESLGASSSLVNNYGFLPSNTVVAPISSTSYGVSLARLDYVEQSASGRSGSASVLLEMHDGPMMAPVSWRASYDYIAAMGPSLLGSAYPRDAGAQAQASVRAVAASQAGIVVVSGLDEDGAIHAFAAGYGAEMRLSDSSLVTLPIDLSWMRMWRDEIVIDGSSKSADRLAVTTDGRFIAAANSASNWLRLYALDASGGIAGTFNYKAEVGDLEFSDIRALGFSGDGTRLYALSNGRDGVFGFDVSASGIVRRDKVMFDAEGSQTLTMRDLVVTSSGAIVASAEATSTLYVLTDSGGLALSDTIVYQTGGPGGAKPASLACRGSGDSFYALCDSSKIVVYGRPDPQSAYQAAGEFLLDANMSGADYIAAGKSPILSDEMVCVLGGLKLGFIIPNPALTGFSKYTVTPDAGNEAGISTGVDLAYLNGAFILAGGTSGIVSVFGRD